MDDVLIIITDGAPTVDEELTVPVSETGRSVWEQNSIVECMEINIDPFCL